MWPEIPDVRSGLLTQSRRSRRTLLTALGESSPDRAAELATYRRSNTQRRAGYQHVLWAISAGHSLRGRTIRARSVFRERF